MSPDLQLPDKVGLDERRREQLAQNLTRELRVEQQPPRRRVPRRPLAIAAGLATAVLLVVVTIPSFDTDDGSRADAAKVLNAAANTALDVKLKPGQYYYVKGRTVVPESGGPKGVKSMIGLFNEKPSREQQLYDDCQNTGRCKGDGFSCVQPDVSNGDLNCRNDEGERCNYFGGTKCQTKAEEIAEVEAQEQRRQENPTEFDKCMAKEGKHTCKDKDETCVVDEGSVDCTENIDSRDAIDPKELFLVRGSYLTEGWLGHDNSVRLKMAPDGNAGFYDDVSRQRWQALGEPSLTDPAADLDYRVGPRRAQGNRGLQELGVTERDVAKRVDDPHGLLALLVSRQKQNGNGGGEASAPGPGCGEQNKQEACEEIFDRIGDAVSGSLGESAPQVRAGLLRAAALLPGVDLQGDVTDHEGRKGEAVELGNTRLVFDLDTHDVLERQEKLGKGELEEMNLEGIAIEPGTIYAWQTILETEVVNSTSERP